MLQTIRYKLQKRLKRLNVADFRIYHSILVQTWGFFVANPIIKGIIDDLERRVPSAEKDSEALFAGTMLSGENELEHIALCYWLLKRTVASGDQSKAINLGYIGRRGNKAEALEYFTDTFVEPFFDYLDEQIDDHRTTLALLRKYKHRVEWFTRDALRTLFENDSLRGEKTLAMDLYAYLHDQGLEFSIEPSSISGKADLISAQTGTERLVADVKIFDPNRSKGLSYIHSGFSQVYQYTKDHNDPFGYLVIFKTCAADLSVNATNQDSSVPYFTHNNKTIFVLIIDIFNYPEPASKRGPLRSYELVETALIGTIENSSTSAVAV